MNAPVSDYAPKIMSAEQMRVVMEQAMGRIGEIAVQQANAAIAEFDKKTAHDRACLVEMRDEVVKYAEMNKARVGESAMRLGRFQENMQRSMTEFREPLPIEPEHPRDLDETVQDVEQAIGDLVHETKVVPMLGVRGVSDEDQPPVPTFLRRALDNDMRRRDSRTRVLGERMLVIGAVALGLIIAIASRIA